MKIWLNEQRYATESIAAEAVDQALLADPPSQVRQAPIASAKLQMPFGLEFPVDLDPATAITSTIRSAFRAVDGRQLVISGFASIENRVSAWLGSCTPMLDVYRAGRDAYRDFATKLNDITTTRSRTMSTTRSFATR
jgi:hypothetical protein